MKKASQQGFTVLEFLVVVGMMMILVALVLVGLTAARKRADDDNRVSRLRTVSLALEQYRDVCRVYPTALTETQSCPALGAKTLSVFIPEIATFDFNGVNSSFFGGSDSPFKYAPLAVNELPYTPCIGYHLGVQLKTNGGYQNERANFKIDDDMGHSFAVCAGSGSQEFDPGTAGSDPYYFDIHK